jgi:hypothetical protein
MATEDELLSQLSQMLARSTATVVLDITALPKRYFCFYLRRLMYTPQVRNLIVTYTDAGEARLHSGAPGRGCHERHNLSWLRWPV